MRASHARHFEGDNIGVNLYIAEYKFLVAEIPKGNTGYYYYAVSRVLMIYTYLDCIV